MIWVRWLIPISIMLFIEPSKMELVTGRIWWFDQIMGQKKLEKAFIRSSFERWRLANQIQPIRLRLNIFKNLFQIKQDPKWTFRQNKSPHSDEMAVQFYSFWIPWQVITVHFTSVFSNSTKGDQILVPCMYENATIIRIVSI